MHCHTSKKNRADWVPPKYHCARPRKDGPILTEKRSFILDTRFHYSDALAGKNGERKQSRALLKADFSSHDIEVVQQLDKNQA